MTPLPRLSAALAAVVVLSVPALGTAVAQVVPPGQQPPGATSQPRRPDPANGRIIAQRWCAECHVVAPDQTRAKADVPTFAAIARKGGVTEESLRRFLMNPHPVMPDMQLGRTEAADLAAYIETQAR